MVRKKSVKFAIEKNCSEKNWRLELDVSIIRSDRLQENAAV